MIFEMALFFVLKCYFFFFNLFPSLLQASEMGSTQRLYFKPLCGLGARINPGVETPGY
jgi:hypothetical protein